MTSVVQANPSQAPQGRLQDARRPAADHRTPAGIHGQDFMVMSMQSTDEEGNP